jgi:C1A family cysteine protease
MPELAEILKNDNDPFQENLLPEKQRVVKREQSDVKESLRMLTQPFEVIKWLREDDQDRKNSFDQHTDRLVRLFQHCSNIWRDGIVGLETYTTLSDYLKHFSEPDNQDIKDFKERFISFFHPLSQEEKLYSNSVEDSDKYKLRAYHLPVSLLLSEAVFRKILNQMEAWFASEIQSQDSSQLFEQEHLEKLKVSQPNIFEDLIQQKIGSQKLETNKCVKRLSASFFKDEKNKDIFIEILQKEFLLVEPIVAVVIKILTPLAFFRQDPLEDVVAEGLRRFEHLLTEKNEDKQQQFLRKSLLGEKGLEQSEVEKVTKKFALMALQQAQSIFDGEIKFKIQEYEKFRCQANHESQWRSEATLYFYLLVKKVIRHFLRINDHPNIDQPILPNNKALNPFEKQEILEINRSAHLEEIKIFNIPQLQIPFRTTYLESFSFNACQPDSLKQYLFLPGVVDLSYWCPEIEDQGSLNTCTAFAGVALLEYFMNRSTGRHTDVSPLFLYKATRNLMNLQGDVGASVRETMKAMALFGIPPEQYWQYDETKVDEEPPSFCYSFAQHFQALKYFRLDYAGILKEVLLIQIKAVIATGFPCIFGFTIYTSAYEAANQQNGWIPFPNEKTDRVVGGHSVVAVGYDDYKEIDRKDRNFPSTGAFLIRNSFGADWGLEGYGWLPYDYVLAGLTADWWSLLKAEWFADDFWQGARGSQGSEQNEFRQG